MTFNARIVHVHIKSQEVMTFNFVHVRMPSKLMHIIWMRVKRHNFLFTMSGEVGLATRD